MLDATVAHTRERRQFGVSISDFQALQHRMADMYIELERAISITYMATLAVGAEPRVRAMAASAAKVRVAKSARFVGQNAIQLHGAMGLTDELPIGWYFRRTTVIETLFGSVDYHLDRYEALAFDDA
jgi:alkylation response protein AidB-like acyl-CoA dehydrogenase